MNSSFWDIVSIQGYVLRGNGINPYGKEKVSLTRRPIAYFKGNELFINKCISRPTTLAAHFKP